MRRPITYTLCCLALVALAGSADAAAAIAYRLSDWNQMHFDDPGKASLHLAAVQKLGCEARQESHGGHTDVVYRSPQWQALDVTTDELAHQWEDWLQGAGFETLHGHTANHEGHDHGAADHAGHDHSGHSHAGHSHGLGHAEEVAYRMETWRTTHLDNPAQLPQLIALMKGLGCEVRSDDHGDHIDISVRCSQWKHVELNSHAAASGWEQWLRNAGFEVRHDH